MYVFYLSTLPLFLCLFHKPHLFLIATLLLPPSSEVPSLISLLAVHVSMDSLDLPPGFRFHPTDEEIITHYLSPKTLHHAFTARPIAEADLNKSEPWDLPSKAKMGEKEWYFFCQRDRKYPTGMRTNRATESGYWKATGKDKEIFRGRGLLVGMKKTLVFYIGRAPNGLKTNWVMHEFRLQPKTPLSNYPKSSKKEWVVCRLFHKNTGLRNSNPLLGSDLMRMNSFTDELIEPHTLPPLMEPPYFTFDVKAFAASSSPMNSYPSPAIDGGGDNWLSRSNSTGLCCKREAPPLLRRHCKPEQVPNRSMLSQETAGVSTDVASCASYDDLAADGGAAMDLANMWRY